MAITGSLDVQYFESLCMAFECTCQVTAYSSAMSKLCPMPYSVCARYTPAGVFLQ